MNRKFQIFVSSTYSDLVEERQGILESILDLGHIPAGMEGFYAADEEQLSYIKKIIDQCDYYILILAGRYGSFDENGISFTEHEYNYALSKGVNVLAFLHGDVDAIASGKTDKNVDLAKRLKEFRDRVSQKRLVSFWHNRDDLRTSVIISLSKAIGESPGIGWVRGDTVASDEILAQINRLRNELETLQEENARLKEQLIPRLANLAELSETFTIRYSHYDRNSQHKFLKDTTLQWYEILKIVGPSILNPSQAIILQYRVKNFLEEQFGHLNLLSIFDSDLDTIKIQLDAHGLITIYSANAVNGGLHEYIQLTDLGKRVLMETATVKATQNDQT